MFATPAQKQPADEHVPHRSPCRSCGRQVALQARFCPSCGTLQDPVSSVVVQSAPPSGHAAGVGRPHTSFDAAPPLPTEPSARSARTREEREPGPSGPQVSDVSRVSWLRKRVGRAAAAMKVIGLFSAVIVLVYSYKIVHGITAVYLAVLVFALAFWLSNRLKTGSSSATLIIVLWTIGLLAYDLVVALPPALRDYRSGD